MSENAKPRRRQPRKIRLVTVELVPLVSEPGPVLREPSSAAAKFEALIGGKDREHFVVLHLDTRHRIRGYETVSVGSLNAAIVHPREVFKGAILANAAAIICGHNHPSGDPTPSEEDADIHGRLSRAGELLGIEVLDSLVIGGGEHWSFRRASVETNTAEARL
jgi:DNA repair protein RadC